MCDTLHAMTDILIAIVLFLLSCGAFVIAVYAVAFAAIISFRLLGDVNRFIISLFWRRS